jgi:hypothetical protein
VGPAAAASTDLTRKLDVDTDYANATISQGAVAGQIATAVALLASQTSINNALANYAQPAYITAQDALLLPTSWVGVPSVPANPAATPPTAAITGVASLDGTTKIPLVQVPALGAGFISGPWGPTATFAGSATNTPIKICDWNIGATGVSFYPRVYMSLLASAANLGRPVVEVWISNAPMIYGAGTLVARGAGRNFWNDAMTVNVVPVPSKTGQVGGTGLSPTYTAWLTAWLFDANGEGVSVSTGNIVSAGLYLWRYQQ